MKKCLSILIWLLMCTGFNACSVQPTLIEGTAMLPAFKEGDKVLFAKKWDKLERGDVVTFKYPKDQTKSYIKRIVGLPGETIEIREGKVFVNGQPLEENYLDPERNVNQSSFPLRTISAKQYIVLGDNRDNSSDSRYWGTVDEQLITGKYYLTYSKAE